MGSEPEKRAKNRWPAGWYLTLGFAVAVTWILTPFWVPRLAGHFGLQGLGSVGVFGDQFGAVGALFSGLAFLGLVYSVILQRRDLDRSIKEMEKSADAQTAQVKLGAVSALLASLPVLIQDEENRLVSTAAVFGFEMYGRGRLDCLALADLMLERRDMEEQLAATVSVLAQRQEELAVATRMKEECVPADRADHAAAYSDISRQVSELKIRRNRERIIAEQLGRLISLRQELAATYAEMKKYQNWKVAESATPTDPEAGGEGAEG